MANPIKKCVLHGAVNNETVDLYPRTNLASVEDMTTFARTLNGAADAAVARNTLEIQTSKDIINIIYPVGSVITLTNDTDPNELYQGTTWVKMEAGRVLVSAGTYTEGSDTYTYTLGDKGGEATHILTAAEMPEHSHTGTTSTNGEHSHSASWLYAWDGSDTWNYFAKSYSNNPGKASGGSFTIDNAGNHDHTFTTDNTGSNAKHENRPPFEVVNRWKRTV